MRASALSSSVQLLIARRLHVRGQRLPALLRIWSPLKSGASGTRCRDQSGPLPWPDSTGNAASRRRLAHPVRRPGLAAAHRAGPRPERARAHARRATVSLLLRSWNWRPRSRRRRAATQWNHDTMLAGIGAPDARGPGAAAAWRSVDGQFQLGQLLRQRR